MTLRRAGLSVLLVALALASATPAARATLPAKLSDAEYWQLIEATSEPNGVFHTDNLVSNEDTLQVVLPDLVKRIKAGGVYLGVGPEQNFTYIAGLQPKMVFILDIRRGNLLHHLMYKALFELSADRVEFVSRLFSRPRPPNLTAASTADQIFQAYASVIPDEKLYDANVLAIANLLRDRHKFKLSDDDIANIASIYANFYSAGPSLSYANSGIGGRTRYPSFQDLQMATDAEGRNRAFLGSEAAYKTVKALEEKNLLVPIVGDFAGPRALRGIGEYVRTHGATVTTFYLSNVEQYLFQNRVFEGFARNVATLPVDESSTFIRSCFTGCAPTSPFGQRAVMLLDPMPRFLTDFAEGRLLSYNDVLHRSR